MCLDEMTGVQVPKGAIFHQGSRLRRRVVFSEPVRRQVEEAAGAVRATLASRQVPAPANDPRCGDCSLLESCLPAVVGENGAFAVARGEAVPGGRLVRAFGVRELAAALLPRARFALPSPTPQVGAPSPKGRGGNLAKLGNTAPCGPCGRGWRANTTGYHSSKIPLPVGEGVRRLTDG